MSLNFDLPPKPVKGPSLFLGTTRSRNCFRLYQNYSDQWNAYASGYVWALKGLLNQATTPGMYPTEVHYYPILFMFRQYLEIRLKNLIINLNSYLGEKEKYEHHNLLNLWKSCHKLVIKFFYDNAEDLVEDPQIKTDFYNDLDMIGKFILDLHSVDPDAQSTRYPEKKSRLPFFNSENAPIIDMNHFSEIVLWIINDLDTIQDMIDEQYQQRCAALDEVRSD